MDTHDAVQLVFGDTRGDGNCFLRALYNVVTLLDDKEIAKCIGITSENEDEAVRQMRRKMAEEARSRIGAGLCPLQYLENAESIYNSCEDKSEEPHPILNHIAADWTPEQKLDKFLELLAQYSGEGGSSAMYSDEYELKLMQELLKNRGIGLIVLNFENRNSHPKNTANFVNTLKRTAAYLRQEFGIQRAVLVIRTGDIHYKYVHFMLNRKNPYEQSEISTEVLSHMEMCNGAGMYDFTPTASSKSSKAKSSSACKTR